MSSPSASQLLAAVVAAPLVTAVVLVAIPAGAPSWVRRLTAAAGAAVLLLLAVAVTVAHPGADAILWTWLDTDLLNVPAALALPPLAQAFVIAIGLAQLAGHARPAAHGQTARLHFAVACLLIVVLAKNLLVLLAGWVCLAPCLAIARRPRLDRAILQLGGACMLTLGTLVLMYYSQGDPDLVRMPALVEDGGALSNPANLPTVAALFGLLMTAAGAGVAQLALPGARDGVSWAVAGAGAYVGSRATASLWAALGPGEAALALIAAAAISVALAAGARRSTSGAAEPRSETHRADVVRTGPLTWGSDLLATAAILAALGIAAW